MDLLEKGLRLLGIFDEEKTFQLRTYISELELWNRKLNLVRADGDELIVRHILDSLAPYAILNEIGSGNIADIGSGAGLPGVPLAFWMERRRFFLIEKMGKRCGFLRNVKTVCGIKNLEVIAGPVEEVNRKFDLCIFRALGNFGVYISKLKKVLNPGGIIAAYKGRRNVIDEELGSIEPVWNVQHVYQIEVPFLKEERHLVLLKKNPK